MRAAAAAISSAIRIALGGAPEDAGREGAEISRLGVASPTHHRHSIAAEAADDVSGERARRPEAVEGAHRRPHCVEADMGARPVVAEGETAAANDGFLSPDPGDRRRAGAGDHKPAVGAGVGADAGGHSVVRRPHEAKARKRLDDPRRVARVLDPREPEADRQSRPVGARRARLLHDLADDRAQYRDRCGKIDMDIRRRPACIHQRLAVGVAQPRTAAGGAAVDAEVERRAGHPAFVRASTKAAAAALSAFAASAAVSRVALAAGGVCPGVRRQMHEDGRRRPAPCRADIAAPRNRDGCRQNLRRSSTLAPEFPPLLWRPRSH